MEKLKKIAKVMNVVFKLVLLFAVVQFVVRLVSLGTNQVALLMENSGADVVKVSGISLGKYEMDFWKEQNISKNYLIQDIMIGCFGITFDFAMNVFVICTILSFLKPMTQGQPYDGTVSKMLRKLGIGCVLICIVGNVISYLQVRSEHSAFFEIAQRNFSGAVSRIAYGYSIQLGYLFIGAVLLVFSLVFRYGEELQIQADETL